MSWFGIGRSTSSSPPFPSSLSTPTPAAAAAASSAATPGEASKTPLLAPARGRLSQSSIDTGHTGLSTCSHGAAASASKADASADSADAALFHTPNSSTGSVSPDEDEGEFPKLTSLTAFAQRALGISGSAAARTAQRAQRVQGLAPPASSSSSSSSAASSASGSSSSPSLSFARGPVSLLGASSPGLLDEQQQQQQQPRFQSFAERDDEKEAVEEAVEEALPAVGSSPRLHVSLCSAFNEGLVLSERAQGSGVGSGVEAGDEVAGAEFMEDAVESLDASFASLDHSDDSIGYGLLEGGYDGGYDGGYESASECRGTPTKRGGVISLLSEDEDEDEVGEEDKVEKGDDQVKDGATDGGLAVKKEALAAVASKSPVSAFSATQSDDMDSSPLLSVRAKKQLATLRKKKPKQQQQQQHDDEEVWTAANGDHAFLDCASDSSGSVATSATRRASSMGSVRAAARAAAVRALQSPAPRRRVMQRRTAAAVLSYAGLDGPPSFEEAECSDDDDDDDEGGGNAGDGRRHHAKGESESGDGKENDATLNNRGKLRMTRSQRKPGRNVSGGVAEAEAEEEEADAYDMNDPFMASEESDDGDEDEYSANNSSDSSSDSSGSGESQGDWEGACRGAGADSDVEAEKQVKKSVAKKRTPWPKATAKAAAGAGAATVTSAAKTKTTLEAARVCMELSSDSECGSIGGGAEYSDNDDFGKKGGEKNKEKDSSSEAELGSDESADSDSGVDYVDEPKATTKAKPKPKTSSGSSASVTKGNRDALVAGFLKEFNESVFDGKIPADLECKWNPRLRKTAGVTYTSTRHGQATTDKAKVRHARIELSSKVLDTTARLGATFLHELCHVAAWLVDGKSKPPHGPAFKTWANRASLAYRQYEVTTCHSYDIHAPHRYECTKCRAAFKRHSKSMKTDMVVCGQCRGTIVYIGLFNRNGEPAAKRAATQYTLFIQDKYLATKLIYGTHAKTMQALSTMWKDAKPKGV